MSRQRLAIVKLHSWGIILARVGSLRTATKMIEQRGWEGDVGVYEIPKGAWARVGMYSDAPVEWKRVL